MHTSCPHFYRFAEAGEDEEAFTRRMVGDLKELIHREGAETIAAFIAEPIMGTGGGFLPPAGLFRPGPGGARENDILFIADEVITGFGRTGAWFATGLYDLKPDIVTLAKGITSAYFPLSASVISEGIWTVLRDASPEFGPLMHGFTYSGHPVGGAVGAGQSRHHGARGAGREFGGDGRLYARRLARAARPTTPMSARCAAKG